MRRLAVLMTLMVLAQGAQAADLPEFVNAPLRGSLRAGTDWNGLYIGGQYGISSTNFDVSGAVTGLRTFAGTIPGASSTFTTLAGYDATTVQNYGGFIGYNWQFDDAVIGFDINYNKGGQHASSVIVPSTFNGTVNGSTYVTTTTGLAAIDVTDYGSLRARGGWAIGRFMPYATAGVAFGRANVSRSITVQGTIDNGGGPVPYLRTGQDQKDAGIFGYSFGGGLDVNLLSGLFMRAELERTLFYSVWGMDAVITSGRVGLGYRF